jgi:hypothetical protein
MFFFSLVTTTLITEDPLKSLNYQRLLTSYTEKCRYDSELWQIVNYFYLLKQIRQKDGENCFIESLAILLIKLNENDIDNLLERLFGVNRQGVLTEVNLYFYYFYDIKLIFLRLVFSIILISIQMLLLQMLDFISKNMVI